MVGMTSIHAAVTSDPPVRQKPRQADSRLASKTSGASLAPIHPSCLTRALFTDDEGTARTLSKKNHLFDCTPIFAGKNARKPRKKVLRFWAKLPQFWLPFGISLARTAKFKQFRRRCPAKIKAPSVFLGKLLANPAGACQQARQNCIRSCGIAADRAVILIRPFFHIKLHGWLKLVGFDRPRPPFAANVIQPVQKCW